MSEKNLFELTDEELLVEKTKLKKSKIFHAVYIGFLVGILIFGTLSWSLLSEKKLVFLIPMLIPIAFIYKLIKSPNPHNDLEDILKERNLN